MKSARHPPTRELDRRPRRLRRWRWAALTPALIALAGCGSSSGGGTSAYPASVIPAGARVLASAVVRPSGSASVAALELGRALGGSSDPYARLVALLETPGSARLSYARDVAGWLGRHAALFFTSPQSAARTTALWEHLLPGESSSSPAFPFSSPGVEGAIVMDTSDAAGARAFLDRQAARAGAHAASYDGVSYDLAAGVSFALVKRFAVIGSEEGIRAVIATARSGGSLTTTRTYARLRGAAPAGSLAQVYLAPGASAPATPSSAGAPGALAGLLGLLAAANRTQVSVVPGAHSLALDADIEGAPGAGIAADLFAPGGHAARTLAELPGESWLALGLGEASSDLGSETVALHTLLTALAGGTGGAGAGAAEAGAGAGAPEPPSSTGTLNLGSLLGALLEPAELMGADSTRARRSYASWMGSAGLFASGSGLLELRGGVVIASRDAALSRQAVATLAGELRAAGASVSRVSIAGTEAAQGVRLKGVPLSLVLAAGRDGAGEPKFVIGLGDASVATALAPSSTLASSPSRRAAERALGEGIEPVLILQVPTLLGLLESLGLTEGEAFSKLMPSLHSLGTVAAGRARLNGQIRRLRVVAGLQ